MLPSLTGEKKSRTWGFVGTSMAALYGLFYRHVFVYFFLLLHLPVTNATPCSLSMYPGPFSICAYRHCNTFVSRVRCTAFGSPWYDAKWALASSTLTHAGECPGGWYAA